ncbi:MAG: CHASE domain-containing protein [Magnetococcales bacterium]|nr:CHASE domain-containing protein [Magnetococcales bacterium]
MQDLLQDHSRQEFYWLGKDRIGTVKKGLKDSVQAVEVFGDVMNSIGPKNIVFEPIAGTYLDKIATLKELMWVPRIPEGEFAAVRQRWSVQSGPPGENPLQKNFKMVADANGGNYYFPLLLARGHSQLFRPGYDVASDELLFSLLRQAEKVGQTVVGTMKLHAQVVMQTKIMVVVPLRDPQEAIEGFVLGMFDLEEIVQQAISLLEPRGMQVLIVDRDRHGVGQLVDAYYSRLEQQPQNRMDLDHWQEWLRRQPYVVQETVQVANRMWQVNAIPIKNVLSGEEFPYTPWIILCGGNAITLIVAVFLFHIGRNLRERNRLYAELEQSTTKLRILFNQSPDTIMTVSREGTVLLSNRSEFRSMESMLGLHQPELLDWYFHALRKVYETGEMDHFQFPVTENEWCEVRFVPIRSEGRIAEVMILSTDISEKHAQQEQAIRHSRLASLGVLAAGMAHEINNPNNTIHFNIASLLKSWPDLCAVLQGYRQEHGEFSVGGVAVEHAVEMLPKLMESIKRNAQRIAMIVDNLKRMARQDKGDFSNKVDFIKVIRNVISILQHQIKRHTDHFEVALPAELPLMVGNTLQLEQLFINLLINALHALPDRAAAVKIVVTLSEDAHWVLVKVEDEGVGMSEQEQASMYTPFYTTKIDQGGIGMGLSIVWSIVQHHGGQIDTTSQPGRGTVISVRLPIGNTRIEPA